MGRLCVLGGCVRLLVNGVDRGLKCRPRLIEVDNRVKQVLLRVVKTGLQLGKDVESLLGALSGVLSHLGENLAGLLQRGHLVQAETTPLKGGWARRNHHGGVLPLRRSRNLRTGLVRDPRGDVQRERQLLGAFHRHRTGQRHPLGRRLVRLRVNILVLGRGPRVRRDKLVTNKRCELPVLLHRERPQLHRARRGLLHRPHVHGNPPITARHIQRRGKNIQPHILRGFQRQDAVLKGHIGQRLVRVERPPPGEGIQRNPLLLLATRVVDLTPHSLHTLGRHPGRLRSKGRLPPSRVQGRAHPTHRTVQVGQGGLDKGALLGEFPDLILNLTPPVLRTFREVPTGKHLTGQTTPLACSQLMLFYQITLPPPTTTSRYDSPPARDCTCEYVRSAKSCALSPNV